MTATMMQFKGFSRWLRGRRHSTDERALVAAGVTVLHLLARRVTLRNAMCTDDEIDDVRQAVAALPFSPVSIALWDLVTIAEDVHRLAAETLETYGRALEDLGQFSLAVDVHALAGAIGRQEGVLSLVAKAINRCGRCLQQENELDAAEKRYYAARAIAQECGDDETELMIDINSARLSGARGDYGAARRLLTDVVARARGSDQLVRPLAYALHDLGTIAQHDGQCEDALVLFGDALAHVHEAKDVFRVMSDVVRALRAMGQHKIALVAAECVVENATQADVRSSAETNVLSILADCGDRESFDRMRHRLEAAELMPRRRCEVLETIGAGLVTLGDIEGARVAYHTLSLFAFRFGIREFEVLADCARLGEMVDRPRSMVQPLSPRCVQAVHEIVRRRG